MKRLQKKAAQQQVYGPSREYTKEQWKKDAPFGIFMKAVCFISGFYLIGAFIYIYQYRKGRKRRAEEAIKWSVYGGLFWIGAFLLSKLL